jgi:hypothetical protein
VGSGRQDTRDACEACGGASTAGGALAHPATVADAVALASDWDGLRGAEEIARAWFGGGTVVWRVVEPGAVARVVRPASWAGLTAPSRARAREISLLGYAFDCVTRTGIRLLVPALVA